MIRQLKFRRYSCGQRIANGDRVAFHDAEGWDEDVEGVVLDCKPHLGRLIVQVENYVEPEACNLDAAPKDFDIAINDAVYMGRAD